MAFSEPKEKRQRVQSEDDCVPASTITSPLYLGDTLEHILSYLDGLSLSRAELVCRRWNEVIVYRRLWRKLYEKKLKNMNSTVKRACLKLELYPFHPQTSLHWRRCADMPVSVICPQSVVIGDVVFVAGWGLRAYKYESRSDKWSVLPPCPVENFGIGQLSGKLVTVGGHDGCAFVGDVYTYEEETQQWEKSIPPMPTPRRCPCVVTYHSSIAVCGVETTSGETNIIEVFKSETSQWYTAAPLPVAGDILQSTIINDTCYLGGYHRRSIMCASLPSLFQSATPHNQPSPDAQQQSVWTMLPDMPHRYSALTSINIGGTLLSLGGVDDEDSCSHDVHSYNPSTKSWMIVGSLPQACAYATAELLPSGQVILIGLKTVYIGTLEL